MFVLDATGSMGDQRQQLHGAGARRVSGSPSRFQCALYSIQSVLKVMPTSLDKVGLMIFPGMGIQYSPTAHPVRDAAELGELPDHQHQVPDRHRAR